MRPRPVVTFLVSLAAAGLALPAGALARDSDGDGLGDRFERKRSKTSSKHRDTDRDGLGDRVEVRKLRTNPRRKDTDRDGLRDRLEVRTLRTNPRKGDSDGDGYSDAVEVYQGSNPLDPASPGYRASPLISLGPIVPADPSPSDTTTPDTTIDSGPSGTTSSRNASFTFGATEPATFECRLDGGPWDSCGPPKRYSGLGDGPHLFEVRARDAAGNVDPTPAMRAWILLTTPLPDTTRPQTTISSGPSGTVSNATANFTFSSSESVSTFQCRIDGGMWGACISPKAYASLPDGSHDFSVRAIDDAGNTDGSPASRTWTVDTVPPDTSISSAPSDPSTSSSASFSFGSPDAGAFDCRFDGGAWSACTSPRAYSGLANGSHTFDVRARDAAGNLDATAASHTWGIAAPPDTTPPDTEIMTGPVGTVSSGSASFSFTSTESGSTFECRLDAGDWGACSAPNAYSGLADGSHTFEVRATDASGNADGSPAARSWTVSVSPPTGGARYLSPSGSDSALCTATAPCRSMNRAYRLAASGDEVELAAGDYGNQTVLVDGSKTSADDVVFRPAAGASVTLGFVRVEGASHLTLRDMRTRGWELTSGTDDVTFQNLDNRGGIYMLSSSNIQILGGAVGPLTNDHPQFASWPPGTRNRNILVDGVHFHDIRRTNANVHGECLQIAGGDNITIRNSRFENCMVFDISFTEYNNSGPMTNGLIENNFFDTPVDQNCDGSGCSGNAYYSLAMNTSNAWQNVTVRNNSSPTAFIMSADGSLAGRNVRVIGNLTPEIAHGNPSGPRTCNPGMIWSHNVFSAQASCSSTDRRVGSLGFVDASAFDLHLRSDSPAREAGAPSDYPATDIDEQARPRGAAPDAGADEY